MSIRPRRYGYRFSQPGLALLTSVAVLAANLPGGGGAVGEPAPSTAIQPADRTPAQLQQLVAPSTFYPDQPVAQLLARAHRPHPGTNIATGMELLPSASPVGHCSNEAEVVLVDAAS